MTTFDDVPESCRQTLAHMLDGREREVRKVGAFSGNTDTFRPLHELGLISFRSTPGGRKRFAQITDAGRALQPDVDAWKAARKAAREKHRRDQAEVDALQSLAPRLLAYVRERSATDPAALELAVEYGRQVEAYLAD